MVAHLIDCNPEQIEELSEEEEDSEDDYSDSDSDDEPRQDIFFDTFYPKIRLFNPIPAGVLENHDLLGVGQFDPPPPL